jgi:hypothetical protein
MHLPNSMSKAGDNETRMKEAVKFTAFYRLLPDITGFLGVRGGGAKMTIEDRGWRIAKEKLQTRRMATLKQGFFTSLTGGMGLVGLVPCNPAAFTLETALRAGFTLARRAGVCGCASPNNPNPAAGRHLRFFCGDPGNTQ